MSDEDTLRRAAAKVRELAAAAPKGPWFPDHEEAEQQGENADEEPFRTEYADDDEWRVGSRPLIDLDGGGQAWIDGMYVVDGCWRGFVEWVSLLGPQMAEPLATWLETEADLVPATAGVGENAPKLLDSIAEAEGVEPPPWEFSIRLSTTPSAVAFACALLGEQVPA